METFESCDGGPGHSFTEPTIRFHGGPGDGFKAYAVAQTYGLPVRDLRRTWTLSDGEPVGPHWELTFWRRKLVRLQREAERGGLLR